MSSRTTTHSTRFLDEPKTNPDTKLFGTAKRLHRLNRVGQVTVVLVLGGVRAN